MNHYEELAEQATIGSILNDGELIKETALRREHYRSEDGQEIFDAILAVSQRGQGVDLVSVCSELEKRGTLERLGGPASLYKLSNSHSWRTNFQHHEKLVIDAWKRRKALLLASEFQDVINQTENNNEIASFIQELQEVEEAGMDVEENMETDIQDWYNDRVSRTGEMSGITTGFSNLDEITGGLRDECLYILAARPAVGKTAWMLCSGLKTSAKGAITVIFSLEMSKPQLFDRMACALGGINSYNLENPNKLFSEQDWKAFNIATAKLNDLAKRGLLIVYDKPGMTIQEIRAKLRKLRRKHPNGKVVAMIDYLQLVKSTTPHREKRLLVSEVSGSLKEISRQAKMPVVALAQLNRGTEHRQEKKPTMSDLKESGDIEQDADAIFLLYREDYYKDDTLRKNVVELIVGKNRHGATGVAELLFFREFSRYTVLDKNLR